MDSTKTSRAISGMNLEELQEQIVAEIRSGKSLLGPVCPTPKIAQRKSIKPMKTDKTEIFCISHKLKNTLFA